MRDLLDVLKRTERITKTGGTAVLATLVKVDGSAYRHAGARMLIESDGQRTGFLSAGCLEADLAIRAKEVFESGQPRVVTYDTSGPEDIVWGLGLGCNGILNILLERTDSPSVQRGLQFIGACIRQRRPGVMATLVFSREDQQVRSRLCGLVPPDGTIELDVPGPLREHLSNEMKKVLQTGVSSTLQVELPEGRAGIFIEAIRPPVRTAIYGSGPDVPFLVTLAKNAGWYVSVLDRRAEDHLREGVPEADEVISVSPEKVSEHFTPAQDTALLIMTHNYAADKELLRAWLPTDARYVGILGPRRRTEQLLEELQKEGFVPTEQQQRKLYSPIGLDIGSDSPGTIALAIVAEVEAVLHGRNGGFLKDRSGPIHEHDAGSPRHG